MKLSEIKGERAIEVFADLLEPIGKMILDEEIASLIRSEGNKVQVVKMVLKKHAKEVIEIMAIIDGVPADEYEVDFVTLPAKLIELFNDEALIEVFQSQSQEETSISSGSATENIGESEN